MATKGTEILKAWLWFYELNENNRMAEKTRKQLNRSEYGLY
jgi:hypothetical protein